MGVEALRRTYRVGDSVRTSSGREGIIRDLSLDGDVASVQWHDGEEFSIRVVHLVVLKRFAPLP